MRKLAAPVVFLVIFGGVLFASAGRIDLPFFWVYLGVMLATVMVGCPRIDPELLRERMRPAPGGVDRNLRFAAGPFVFVQLIVAGLDVGRFGWSAAMPVWLQVVGVVLMTGGTWLAIWAMVVNRFFSPVVRVQSERGHHVVTAGPYAWVRHPGYVGVLVGSPAASMALGSWWSLAAVAPMVVLMLRRAVIEDAYLMENLAGYREYAARVRYRLVPGIW